ncbi:MAG: cytochrome c biosis protein CcmG [Actinomycetota bacterium]|jgi:cytochrome c biogenesis protein CcmG/thiol:disulfide interchange protein DsbE
MSGEAPARSRVAPWAAAAAGVVIAGLLAVLVLAEPGSSDDASSPLLGNPAPAVVSTTLEGDRFDLSRRKGSWVVLNFFNSTCVPCIREHPVLVEWEASQGTASDPVELYTIVNDDSDEAVTSFFTANGGDWPKIRDDDGAIAVAFGVAKVPETWVIDPAGFVRLRVLGEIEKGFLESRLGELRSASGQAP